MAGKDYNKLLPMLVTSHLEGT